MKYMVLIYSETPTTEPNPELMQQVMAEYGAYGAELDKRKAQVTNEALQGPETATTVRVRNGKAKFTDGPFVESKEQIGGFYLIEAKDKTEALDLAAMCPGTKYGAVEVRPVIDFSTMR